MALYIIDGKIGSGKTFFAVYHIITKYCVWCVNDFIWKLKEGVELEHQYAIDTMPRGILGMNSDMFEEYLQFIANRRCLQIGLKEQYPGAENPFPWMSEMMDLKKEKNFFETRVTEYQTGGTLSWDDED